MTDVPWYFRSPSVFTIALYIGLISYIMWKMHKRVVYGQRKWLNCFADAFFILGFIVLISDTQWLIVDGLRFAWFFPDSQWQIIFLLLRNIVGLILCYLMVGGYFQNETITPSSKTFYLWSLNLAFFGLWFYLSPNPAFTDWTYAIANNYPFLTVLTSFLLSHVIGRAIFLLVFFSYFRH